MHRDKDIRPILIKSLVKCNTNEPDTLIVEEFGLCQGDVRVDVAVVNGSINGYEIKSDRDTLKRLPRQQEIYSKVFDSVTLISTKKHLKKAIQTVPQWWGINIAKLKNEKVVIQEVREPKANDEIDTAYLVQLLWRNEAFEILKSRNLHKGIVRKPRYILWDRLVNYLTIEELKEEIRTRIKLRHNWRSVQTHVSNDD